MFIQTEATPNPATLKFIPGKPVLPGDTREYLNAEEATESLEDVDVTAEDPKEMTDTKAKAGNTTKSKDAKKE